MTQYHEASRNNDGSATSTRSKQKRRDWFIGLATRATVDDVVDDWPLMFDCLFDVTLSTDVRRTISGHFESDSLYNHISKTSFHSNLWICWFHSGFWCQTRGWSILELFAGYRTKHRTVRSWDWMSWVESQRYHFKERRNLPRDEQMWMEKRTMRDWERVHNRHVWNCYRNVMVSCFVLCR